MYVFVGVQCLLVVPTSSVATGHHEMPLYLRWPETTRAAFGGTRGFTEKFSCETPLCSFPSSLWLPCMSRSSTKGKRPHLLDDCGSFEVMNGFFTELRVYVVRPQPLDDRQIARIVAVRLKQQEQEFSSHHKNKCKCQV